LSLKELCGSWLLSQISSRLHLLHTDKNIAIKEAARNVKWARGTAAHARQPDNKGENSAT